MGITSSTPSHPNPNPSYASMSPSSEEKPTSPIQENQEKPTSPIQEFAAETQENPSEELIEEGDEEEEEGECGFCLFMKGGGCKETFIEWEKCVEEGEKNKEDIVEKCFQVTAALKKCMEEHSDYYAPLLDAEKAAEKEALKQLEEEKQRLSEGEGGGEGEELGKGESVSGGSERRWGLDSELDGELRV